MALPLQDEITTQTMDYVSRGLPFVTNDGFDGGNVVVTPTVIFMTTNSKFFGS